MKIPKLVAAAALLVTLLLADSSGAQPASVEPVPTDPAAADAGFASQFGRGAEEVTARLNELERSLEDAALIQALEKEVETYTHRTAKHWHETSRLLARNLRSTALDSLTTYWKALDADLDAVETRIAARVKRRDAELASLETLRTSWSRGIDAARAAGAPAAVLERMQATIDAIDAVRPRLEQRRARLLVLQDSVSRAFQHCADALARIDDARGEAFARMLQPQEPPLWRTATDPGATLWNEGAFASDLSSKLEAVGTYVESYRGRLVLSLLVILLLVGLLRWAGRRLAAVAAAGDAPTVAFRAPIASALLVGLLLTVPLRPSPPYEFQQSLLVVLLAASMFVFRPIVSPRMRVALYVACATYVLSVLVQLLEPAPRVEQLLLVLEMSVLAALLVWALRHLGATPAADAGFLHTVMRALAVVFATCAGLAALVAALGYLDLADLLGVGLLLALLLSVGLLAVRVALDDVLRIALAHGPVARLRTVQRHRAAIDRGLRATIDVAILGIWAWLVLGRFQVREPSLAFVDGLLGTTLRAGGLALPVGQVLAFAIVLIVVFVGTRAVVVLLEEDVFSRMTLPRGVPYALSTLTRYVLLLTGFLLALGALGLDLTRITVLVSALGLGIGFGLQQIMNNFMSGLILLFERPVQVGDSIQMDGLSGDVLRIGIRSSTLRTSQGAEVIVPNSKMIEENVTNWTLSDRRRRCDLDLGVAADDDVERVMQTLVEVARRHPRVAAAPGPEALLVRLGRNANHYQLRFWTDSSGWARVRSDLAVALHRELSGVRMADPSAPPRPPKHGS